MLNLQIATLFGVPLRLNATFAVPFVLVAWVLTFEVYPQLLPRGATSTHLAMALASVVVFFSALVAHELAHSLVARRYDLKVSDITLFLLGGVARLERDPRDARTELLMAAAGPLASLVLAVGFASLWFALGAKNGSALQVVVAWLAWMNAVVAVFNILPVFPLDGGRVFRALLWMATGNPIRATSLAAWSGRLVAWALLGVAAATLLRVGPPLFDGPAEAAWFALIGLFLEVATRQTLVRNRLAAMLRRYRASDLMVADPPVLAPATPLSSLAEDIAEACYVGAGGELAGVFTPPREDGWQRSEATAAEAMVPCARLRATSPDAPASEVLMDMEAGGHQAMPVVTAGRVVGLISRRRLVGVLEQAGLGPS